MVRLNGNSRSVGDHSLCLKVNEINGETIATYDVSLTDVGRKIDG
jgi:hypothetical protein